MGKSAVALLLAERLGGELISVDSMQVYRGLDLGTAKPTLAERNKVAHHLIDVVDLTGSFDAGQFVELARVAHKEILARGKIPIFCGGTGLYFKAFLEGLGGSPPADHRLRATLLETPLPLLLEELKNRDPQLHSQIDVRNPRRVVRALEVLRLTGKPYSEQRAVWRAKPDRIPGRAVSSGQRTLFFGFDRSSGELHERIEERVDAMFERGLVAETERLLTQGLANNPTAMQAIGYRQAVEYLRGQRTLPETVSLLKQRTRHLAKRQRTWLRRQCEMEWIGLNTEQNPETVADGLIARIERAS